ncbi:MurR/RpiR family transcriptional regulator [Priestia koreensis]|uniref:RpiR family transcriptional regulator n=1 Tax=Priestia koreensis TaxID=284581 RepID=A0A0M0LIZ8_9BACI|nr:MurR/RpiR family transcriptional regulator [Priestia koreensis]KOO50693.1 RpiR family transcriptional regulator [Priestia koreensis]MCM3003285.1 MurR/RpiR family transcriptional regulator [Priestia koreensis]
MFPTHIISTFNELEHALYKYVLAHAEQVVYMRIRDLATESHVSTSTILRFCRKLNCDGFTEFKVKLKMYLSEQHDRSKPLKEMNYFLSEFMDRTLNGDFHTHMEKAAMTLHKKDNLLFVGIGSSGILAQYGARYFSSLGRFALYINDPYFPIQSHHLHNSITVALSVSGETSHTIEQARRLKEQGNQLISITNNANCTLAQMSDVNIPYYVTEEHTSIANMPINITTQLPVMYILETLARNVYKLDEQK